MTLTGEMLLGSRRKRGQAGHFQAADPRTGEPLLPEYGISDDDDVAQAAGLAAQAFYPFRTAPLETRARLLDGIADNIEALGDTLIERAAAETALPVARLQGERARTVGQLRRFAAVVRRGEFQRVAIDSQQSDDLRLVKTGLGPVAVFGASNFPLAFSVAGGDTASALAAGCPVVVKAHPAHPGTSELVGDACRRAVEASGLPEGVFSLLYGERETGSALVAHPAIQAVGFTGSRAGGMALIDIARQRKVPIPVYAEMSCINPIFLLPGALQRRAQALGSEFVDSLTLGCGQFCTNPGLVIACEGGDLDTFRNAASAALADKAAGALLTRGIARAYREGADRLEQQPGVQVLARGQQANNDGQAQPLLCQISADDFLASDVLQQEVFGPASLIVVCRDAQQLEAVAGALEGQLTATLHLADGDTALAGRLLPTLERMAGRLLVNGFPTGVSVSAAMVHGGPWPSTSSPLYTSVGDSAIERFLRPICYQNFPTELLPAALKDDQ